MNTGDIDSIIEALIERKSNITDIYIHWWGRVSVRINGNVKYTYKNSNWDEYEIKVLNEVVETFLSRNLKKYQFLLTDFKSMKSFDFNYKVWKNYLRVNASMINGAYILVIRVVNKAIIPIDELWINSHFLKWILNANKGLFLVSGATWSGKSTTLASIIDHFNKTRSSHIVTFENPIEQQFSDIKSVIHQYELWRDFKSYEDAVENVLRQDPDIIIIWEIRNKETLDIAIRLAETGHLVLGTIHWKWADWIIGKISRMYENPKVIHGALSDILIWVLYQQKFIRDNWDTVVCIETLYNNHVIKSWLLQSKLWNLQSVMMQSRESYMTTMDQYLENEINEKYNLTWEEILRFKNAINDE